MLSFSQYIREQVEVVLFSPKSAADLLETIDGNKEITPIPSSEYPHLTWKTSGIILKLKPKVPKCKYISDYDIIDVMVFEDAKTEFRALRLDRRLPATYMSNGTSIAAILSVIGK